jgi:hypothetical protein
MPGHQIEPPLSEIKTEEERLHDLQYFRITQYGYQKVLEGLENGQENLRESNMLLLYVNKTPFREETKQRLRKVRNVVCDMLNYRKTVDRQKKLQEYINKLKPYHKVLI